MKIAIIISTAIHIGLIAVIAFFSIPPEMPMGDGIVAVDIVGENNGSQIYNPPIPPLEKGGQANIPPFTKGGQANIPPFVKGGEGGFNNEQNGSNAAFGSPSGNPILTQIRLKIERAKYYPAIAKRQRLEGRIELSLRLNSDGSVSTLHITKPCGIELLDNSALETVKMAAPYPYYEEPINLSIKYELYQ